MPSVIASLEHREPRAREDLDAWMERLREAQDHVAVCQERLDCARIGREEVLWALAEEGEAVAGAWEAEALATPPASAGFPGGRAGPGRGGRRLGWAGSADGSARVLRPAASGVACRRGPRGARGAVPAALRGGPRPDRARLGTGSDDLSGPGRAAVERGGEGPPPRVCAEGPRLAGPRAGRPVHPGCGPSRGGADVPSGRDFPQRAGRRPTNIPQTSQEPRSPPSASGPPFRPDHHTNAVRQKRNKPIPRAVGCHVGPGSARLARPGGDIGRRTVAPPIINTQ